MARYGVFLVDGALVTVDARLVRSRGQRLHQHERRAFGALRPRHGAFRICRMHDVGKESGLHVHFARMLLDGRRLPVNVDPYGQTGHQGYEENTHQQYRERAQRGMALRLLRPLEGGYHGMVDVHRGLTATEGGTLSPSHS